MCTKEYFRSMTLGMLISEAPYKPRVRDVGPLKRLFQLDLTLLLAPHSILDPDYVKTLNFLLSVGMLQCCPYLPKQLGRLLPLS